MPPFMARVNKAGAPVTLLLIQAVIVTVLALLYFVMKDVSVAFFVRLAKQPLLVAYIVAGIIGGPLLLNILSKVLIFLAIFGSKEQKCL